MTKIDCNVVSCSYNEDHSCRRHGIDVMGEDAKMSCDTSCGSFTKHATQKASNMACSNCKDTDIHCDATKCKFNEKRKCTAESIGISGGHADSVRETECASFVC